MQNGLDLNVLKVQEKKFKKIVYQFTIQSNVPFNGNENDVVVVRSDCD